MTGRRRVGVFGWVAVLALGCPEAVPGQGELRLGAAVDSALARHPSLAAARAEGARAASGVEEARAGWLPSVSLEASATRFEEPMVVAPLHGFDPRQPPLFDQTLVQGAVSVGYTVYDGGARGARVRRAVALTRAAAVGEEAVRQALLAQTTRAYLGALSARELSDAHARRVDAMEQERGRAARMLEQGRAARVALLRVEAALSAARAELIAARSALAVAERELARAMGVPPGRVSADDLVDVRLAPGERVPGRDELVERARGASPEVERLRARVAAAEAGRREARALWMPRLALAGRYVEYGTLAGPETGEWQGGVQLTYPLFTGGVRGAAAARAEAEVSAARAELALAEERAGSAVDQALAALESARARVEALESGARQAEEVARIERLALDAGAGVQADYLAALAELLRVRAALVEGRHAEIEARLELARATGALSREWIERNLEAQR